jgi:hypothetical protein
MDINSPRPAEANPLAACDTALPAPPAPVSAPQNTVAPIPERAPEGEDRPFSPKKGFLASMRSGGAEMSQGLTPK